MVFTSPTTELTETNWKDLLVAGIIKGTDATEDFCNKHEGVCAPAEKILQKICQPNGTDKPSKC